MDIIGWNKSVINKNKFKTAFKFNTLCKIVGIKN